MNALKSLLLLLFMALSMSSCIVAGPGYYRPRPGFRPYRAGPRYYQPHYHNRTPRYYHGPRRY